MDNPSNDQPPHNAQAYQVSEERRRWFFFAIITVMLMVGGFVVFLSAYQGQFKNTFDRGIVLGLNASTLALLLACAYFYAFRFFDDLFYLFLAIGWMANACYLPFEFLFESKCTPGQPVVGECLEFLLYTFAISFVSSVSFYSSTLTKPKDGSHVSAWTTLGLCAVSVAVLTGASYLLFNKIWPTGSYAVKFAAYTTPGALFAAYGLFRVARHITGALKTPKMSSNRTLSILSLTFYLYALLQLTYLLKIYLIEEHVRWIFTSFFVFAFAIKLTNVYCLINVLLTVKYPEFVQQEAELTALQERLSRQSELEAIGAIAASIEHDIKTPLAGISTKLAAMRRRYSDDKIREYIERLEADKNRITAIAKVVPYMRAAKDFWDRDEFMRKVSIVELVNLAIKAVKVEMSLDTDKFYIKLAPSDPKLSIRAYNPMLEQMLVNLFKNGIEAIREAGKDSGAINIRIAAVRAVPKEAAADYDLKEFARWVRVEIEDNGCGIPPENIPKLTSLFTTKYERKPNGGIGLYIARRLIQIHGGCIGITSAVGKGTIVTFYLPEWEAYKNYALGHPDAPRQSYNFDDDIAAIHMSDGNRQETHAIAE